MEIDPFPPERIAHLVDAGPEHLRFASAMKPTVLTGMGLGIGLVISLILIMISMLVAVGAVSLGAEPDLIVSLPMLLIAPCAVISGLGLVVGFVLAQRPRMLTVTPGAMELSGFAAPEAHIPDQLVIDGKPGFAMEVRANNKQLGKFNPRSGARGWDFQSVGWLAHRMGAILEIEVTDRRSAEDWHRWATDPLYRAQASFDASRERNAKQFPAHHATPPRPAAHRVDLEGMRIELPTGFFRPTVIELTPTLLVLSDRKYALADVTRAGVAFNTVRHKNHTTYYGRLQILVGGRVKTIARMKVEKHGGTPAGKLLWVAEEFMRHASNARPHESGGSFEDVPSDLANILRPDREPA